MRLSESQRTVLRRANSSMACFRGHLFKTIESLYRRGLVTYVARRECVRCGRYDCQKHVGSRWEIYVTVTGEGEALLKQIDSSVTINR